MFDVQNVDINVVCTVCLTSVVPNRNFL